LSKFNKVFRGISSSRKVLYRGNKAIGLEYVGDTVLRPDADQAVKTVYASRLVIVSGGAFGSPTILER